MRTIARVMVSALALAACSEAPPVAIKDVPPLLAVTPTGPRDLGVQGTTNQAHAISSNGTVVGVFNANDGSIRAFVWTSKAGSSQLTPPLGSAELDWAADANDAGQAVGWSNLPIGQRAILWTKGTPVDIGTLRADNSGAANANGINRMGQIVGESSGDPGGSRAFLWTPTSKNATTGSMVDLGNLGGASARAFDISETGQVVGTSLTASGELHAFLWTPAVVNGTAGTMIDLGPSAAYAEAYGINERGEVTGQWSAVITDPVRAYKWTATTGFVDLGTLPGGLNAAGSGLDQQGRVVGQAISAAGNRRPVVWTTKGGILDLGTLADGGALPEQGSGAALNTNPKGQVVGWSQNSSGQTKATLWNLP